MNRFLHVGKSDVYERDIAVMKKFREDYYRIVLHRVLRKAGFEEENSKGKKNTANSSAKFDSSISRTKSRIFELAMCNDWKYFTTMTLNKEIHDRKDLIGFKKKLSKWLNNYNRLNEIEIKYLLIPEQHKDKSWHMHGLIMGLPKQQLTEFTMQDKLPLKILEKIRKGIKVFNWKKYAKAFGYISLEEIRNAESISKYMTKYITKEMMKTRIDLNDHLYYCSKGLKRAEVIYKSHLRKDLIKPDFENEYVKTKNVTTYEEAISYFTDSDE